MPRLLLRPVPTDEPDGPAARQTAKANAAPGGDGDQPGSVLRLTFDSGSAQVRVVLSKVSTHLTAAGLGSSELGTIELALAEALNNVVEHAYPDDMQGRIDLHLHLTSVSLKIHISDRGGAMPGLNLPPGEPARVDVPSKDLPEGGFGWFLIRSLASDLTYARDNGQNHLTLRFDLARTG